MIIAIKPPFASTKADPEQSQAEITKLLRKYGVSGIQWTTDFAQNRVQLRFLVEISIGDERKQITFEVEPPLFLAKRRTWSAKHGRYETIEAPNWAQSFRLLYWWLKAKLEAVAYGLVSIEQEFLSQAILQLPSGERMTIGAAVQHSFVSGQLALEANIKRPTVQATRTNEGEST